MISVSLRFLVVIMAEPTVANEPMTTPIVVFPAAEATQAVAVDEDAYYAIASSSVAKYDRKNHARIAHWQATKSLPLVHLNSGIVIESRLYCAHSNYPRLPMKSSIEVWDTRSLEHVESIAVADAPGSLTWIDQHDGSWWMCFAHYDGAGGQEGKSHADTVLVRYNNQFEPLARWKFPPTVLARFKPFSCSGGAWGPDDLLYCTGHDHAEVYVQRVVSEKPELEHVATFPFPIEGQGIAWRASDRLLFGIRRKSREIIGSPLPALR